MHLLTLTRGEMGEVIPPKLQHLEVGKPGNSDNGEALGEYRTVELNNATAKLGVRKRSSWERNPPRHRARSTSTVIPAWRGAKTANRWRTRRRVKIP